MRSATARRGSAAHAAIAAPKVTSFGAIPRARIRSSSASAVTGGAPPRAHAESTVE